MTRGMAARRSYINELVAFVSENDGAKPSVA